MRVALLCILLTSLAFADAKTLFVNCKTCHGKYAEKPKGTKTAPANLTEDQIVYALTKYRDSFQTASGNSKIMATNVRRFTDQDIVEIAAYIKQVQAERQAEIEALAAEQMKALE
ncbi:MAG: c-type cytochrome [Helicobacteraceae bacterium]|jgi:cytochrome c553|nr:c-type cytochrome [Helicobacteraceae bacterium]